MKVVILLSFLVASVSAEPEAPKENPIPSNVRIVGGQDAVQNQYPWMAAIFRDDNFFCGGSYLQNVRSSSYHAYVLTAAHCVKDYSLGDFRVYLGSYYLSMPDDIQDYEQVFTVTASFTHPDYNPDSLENDIGLLRLDRTPERTDSVQRGFLTRREIDFTSTGTVIGWGDTTEGGNLSPVLQQVDLRIQNDSVCGASMGPPYDSTSMFCAGPPDGDLDACTGDSGGPFMVRDGNRMRISGLVSWGVGCARRGKYGVYSDVKAAKVYIKNILKRTS